MFCAKIKNRLKALLRSFDSYVDTHIDTALQISEQLKKALASPAADIVTAIIPGNLDDTIRKKLLDVLNHVIPALTIAEACKGCDALDDRLSCFITQLGKQAPELQDAILQKLASLLAAHLDGQRLTQSLYDLYTQAKYSAAKSA